MTACGVVLNHGCAHTSRGGRCLGKTHACGAELALNAVRHTLAARDAELEHERYLRRADTAAMEHERQRARELEAALTKLVEVSRELLGGHWNLYKSAFGESADPNNDLCRRQVVDATRAAQALLKAGGREGPPCEHEFKNVGTWANPRWTCRACGQLRPKPDAKPEVE